MKKIDEHSFELHAQGNVDPVVARLGGRCGDITFGVSIGDHGYVIAVESLEQLCAEARKRADAYAALPWCEVCCTRSSTVASRNGTDMCSECAEDAP